MPVKFIFDDPVLACWMLFHQTFNGITRCEELEFAKVKLTTQQHSILMAVKYNNNKLTPTMLADWVERNANSITLIIDRMEKSGLVKRVRDAEDHRFLRIGLTEKGENAIKESNKIGDKLVRDLLENLSEKEIESFQKTLNKIRDTAISKCYPDTTYTEVKVGRRGAPSLKRKK